MSKRANAQDTFTQDLARLRRGFENLTWMADPRGEALSLNDVKKTYDELFGESVNWDSIAAAKSYPRFDEATYPSLFDAIQVLPDDMALLPKWWEGLPTSSDWWADEGVEAQMAESPLLRALVAFLWKQGDLQTVAPLIQSLAQQGHESTAETAAVMRQFGSHLLEPLEEPIFDQHTSRALLLFQTRAWSNSFTRRGYIDLFGRGRNRVPTTPSSLTDLKRRDSYVEWWKKSVKERLPKITGSDLNSWKTSERAQALLWMDRFMFSLGKAAKGLYDVARPAT